MTRQPEHAQMVVTPFVWDDWPALWAIRFAHLVEHGIVLDDTSPPDRSRAVPDDDPEWDFHHIQQVYLNGNGNFWLARFDDEPVGYVGAQDLGGAVELRRMYVKAAYRRHGVGSALVRALLTYCAGQGAPAVELWTAAIGSGMHLYRTLGFRVVDGPGPEFTDLLARTRYVPGADEVRMRLDLR